MKELIQISIALLVIGLVSVAEAKTVSVQASKMTSAMWQKALSDPQDTTFIEFRQGDELPVAMSSEGDFLETRRPIEGSVTVKRNFWLLIYKGQIGASLDGVSYRTIDKLVSGSLTAGATADPAHGAANAINIVLKAELKHP
jgi:hypothetical protein